MGSTGPLQQSPPLPCPPLTASQPGAPAQPGLLPAPARCRPAPHGPPPPPPSPPTCALGGERTGQGRPHGKGGVAGWAQRKGDSPLSGLRCARRRPRREVTWGRPGRPGKLQEPSGDGDRPGPALLRTRRNWGRASALLTVGRGLHESLSPPTATPHTGAQGGGGTCPPSPHGVRRANTSLGQPASHISKGS